MARVGKEEEEEYRRMSMGEGREINTVNRKKILRVGRKEEEEYSITTRGEERKRKNIV